MGRLISNFQYKVMEEEGNQNNENEEKKQMEKL